MKAIPLLILSLTLFACAQGAHAKTEAAKMNLTDAQIPAPPAGTGGFGKILGDTLIVARGAEPNAPLIVAYRKLSAGNEEPWKTASFQLPASTAVAQSANALFCVGGTVGGAATTRVSQITIELGEPVLKELPPIPSPRSGAAAGVIGSNLVVVGGVSSTTPEKFERTLWTLDLSALSSGASWTAGPDFPGKARANAAATVQYDMLCVFGGADASGLLADAWLFRPKPLEGTEDAGWKRAQDVPTPVINATALSLGQANVVLVAKASVPMLYHTITDAWCSFDKQLPDQAELPVKQGDKILLLGERSQEISFPRTVRNLALIDYIVIVGYFVLIASIGFFFSRQESSEEFSLGNRKVKWWAAGVSMFATGASAISFMAIPALAFATNLVWLLPVLMLIPAYYVNAYFLFALLRKMEITSTYEYLERRFNSPLRLIASAQCIMLQTIGRSAVVLVLPSLAIATVTGMNVFHSVILMGVITTIYTAIGGFESVIWTEFFQGILKFLAPLAMIVVCIMALPGGTGEFIKTGLDYRKFDFAIISWDITVPALWILFLGQLLTFTIGTAGDQPIIQRVFSSPTSEVRRVTGMNAACGIIIGIMVNILGLAIFCYFKAHPEKFDPTSQNDQIVPLFVTQGMPAGFAGMVIAAIFASAMATVASAMNSVATLFTEDFYARFRPAATDKQRLKVLKATSYVVGFVGTIIALMLAWMNPKSMMIVWSQIVSLLGGGIVGVYSLGMFTTRANGFGAVCGAILSIFVTLLVKLYTPIHWAAFSPIAILTCLIAGYFFSLLKPQTKNLEGLTIFTPKQTTPPSSAPALAITPAN